jgi:hypothetical protein
MKAEKKRPAPLAKPASSSTKPVTLLDVEKACTYLDALLGDLPPSERAPTVRTGTDG